jgi:hypothetical protein
LNKRGARLHRGSSQSRSEGVVAARSGLVEDSVAWRPDRTSWGVATEVPAVRRRNRATARNLDAEFSAPSGEIPQALGAPASASSRTKGFHAIEVDGSWRGSCPKEWRESPMFRGSVLSLVLLLAVGQDTGLLCRVWCHPGGAAMAECHDRVQSGSTSPSVTGNDRCGGITGNGVLLIREDLRRVSDQDARYALVVPRFQMPSSSIEARLGSEPSRASPRESRPLIVALRI